MYVDSSTTVELNDSDLRDWSVNSRALETILKKKKAQLPDEPYRPRKSGDSALLEEEGPLDEEVHRLWEDVVPKIKVDVGANLFTESRKLSEALVKLSRGNIHAPTSDWKDCLGLEPQTKKDYHKYLASKAHPTKQGQEFLEWWGQPEATRGKVTDTISWNHMISAKHVNDILSDYLVEYKKAEFLSDMSSIGQRWKEKARKWRNEIEAFVESLCWDGHVSEVLGIKTTFGATTMALIDNLDLLAAVKCCAGSPGNTRVGDSLRNEAIGEKPDFMTFDENNPEWTFTKPKMEALEKYVELSIERRFEVDPSYTSWANSSSDPPMNSSSNTNNHGNNNSRGEDGNGNGSGDGNNSSGNTNNVNNGPGEPGLRILYQLQGGIGRMG